MGRVALHHRAAHRAGCPHHGVQQAEADDSAHAGRPRGPLLRPPDPECVDARRAAAAQPCPCLSTTLNATPAPRQTPPFPPAAIVNDDMITTLQGMTLPIMVMSRLTQIITVVRNKATGAHARRHTRGRGSPSGPWGTLPPVPAWRHAAGVCSLPSPLSRRRPAGKLSSITSFLNAIGAAARVFTTLQEVRCWRRRKHCARAAPTPRLPHLAPRVTSHPGRGHGAARLVPHEHSPQLWRPFSGEPQSSAHPRLGRPAPAPALT